MHKKNNATRYMRLCFVSVCFFLVATLISPISARAIEQTSVIPAKAECVMELNSRRILYEANSDIRLPMASTTKIATAATVLDLCKDISTELEIPKTAEGIEGSSVYLKSGDVYSVEDLLYGLMLRSGNDCATALAIYCAGNTAKFSTKMNETAQKAGAFHTVFKNPHGLPCNGHYTTARDLSLITCYAMQKPIFCKIVSTQYYEPRNWKNKNKMLFQYEGAIGVKTGYTKEAGRCLVSAAKRKNMTLICSVLHCNDTYGRSTQLLNDAFAAYHYTQLLFSGQTFSIKTDKGIIGGKVLEDFYYPLLEAEKEYVEITTYEQNSPRLKDGNEKIIGKIEISLAKRLLFSGNLYKL